VLLLNGTFEMPPFEEGNLYRVLVGGMSHVGAGDGCRVYANGREIFSRKTSVDRRAGGVPVNAQIPKDRWPDFTNGTVNLAANGFMHYHEKNKEYGNYLTVFIQRMKLPPMGEEMLSRAAALIPMRSAEWQSTQDPDTNVEPDDGKFRWDGVFVPNPAIIGSWQVIGQIESLATFDAGTKPVPIRTPRFERMTFKEDGSTDSPLWLQSGNILMDLDEFQALRIEARKLDGKEYLLIEAGGFDTKLGTAWTSPWLVLERQ